MGADGDGMALNKVQMGMSKLVNNGAESHGGED